MDSALVGAQLLLAAVFGVAGVAKLSDLSASRQAVSDFGVPARIARAVGVLIPVCELLVAVTLVFESTARWGALGALILLLGFSLGIANALRLGKDVDCGCFGPVYSATASTATLVRNLVLAAVAAFVVVEGPAPSISSWVEARSAAELVAIGLSLAALVFLAIVLWLRAQNRSLRRSLSESPNQGPFIEGLPPGTFAPNFTLPDEHGHVQTLDSLLARGLPVVLMFFDQTCGPCEQVATHAARWQAMMSDRLTIAIISAGSHEQSGSTWAEYRLENVLYDEPIAVRDRFRLRSTPTALIIDPTGIIGTTPVGGEHAIEVLVRLALERARSDSHRQGPMPMAELGGRAANA